MISIAQLLFLVNKPALTNAELHFIAEGFTLQSDCDGSYLWVRPLANDRAEVVSLTRLEGMPNSVTYLFSSEEICHRIKEEAIVNFDFKLVEDEEECIMSTEELVMILKEHEFPRFKLYSLKILNRSKEREVKSIQVVLLPPSTG